MITPQRGTGRTTNLALQYVRTCLDKAGTPVDIWDHHDTEDSHRDLTYLVSEVMKVLGIEHSVHPHAHQINVLPRPDQRTGTVAEPSLASTSTEVQELKRAHMAKLDAFERDRRPDLTREEYVKKYGEEPKGTMEGWPRTGPTYG